MVSNNALDVFNFIPKINPNLELFSSDKRIPSDTKKLANAANAVALIAAAGYLSGKIFPGINPVGGAIIGAAFATTTIVVNYLAKKMTDSADTTTAKIITFTLSFLAAAVATTAGKLPNAAVLKGVGVVVLALTPVTQLLAAAERLTINAASTLVPAGKP